MSHPANTLCFKLQFPLSVPSQRAPVRAVADIRVHLGVPEMDRVTVFLPDAHTSGRASLLTAHPRSDIAQRALREIRGAQAGAIRKRAFELAAADAALTLIASF